MSDNRADSAEVRDDHEGAGDHCCPAVARPQQAIILPGSVPAGPRQALSNGPAEDVLTLSSSGRSGHGPTMESREASVATWLGAADSR